MLALLLVDGAEMNSVTLLISASLALLSATHPTAYEVNHVDAIELLDDCDEGWTYSNVTRKCYKVPGCPYIFPITHVLF